MTSFSYLLDENHSTVNQFNKEFPIDIAILNQFNIECIRKKQPITGNKMELFLYCKQTNSYSCPHMELTYGWLYMGSIARTLKRKYGNNNAVTYFIWKLYRSTEWYKNNTISRAEWTQRFACVFMDISLHKLMNIYHPCELCAMAIVNF